MLYSRMHAAMKGVVSERGTVQRASKDERSMRSEGLGVFSDAASFQTHQRVPCPSISVPLPRWRLPPPQEHCAAWFRSRPRSKMR